ncbi:MAG: hypothetical protein R6W82_01745 [bacterium]
METPDRTPDAPHRTSYRRILLSLIGLLACLLLLWFVWGVLLPAWKDPAAFFTARRSVRWEARIDSTWQEGPLVQQSLRISGFLEEDPPAEHRPPVAFDAYYSRPAGTEDPVVAMVVLGGIRTGRDAIRIIGDRPSVGRVGAFLTMDYPYSGPRSFRGIEMLPWVPRVREALFDGVEAVRLALDFLEAQPEVDPARMVLLGGSLGAFYVVDAGALDSRPAAIVSFMGGGDLTALLESNLRAGGHVPTRLLSVPLAAYLGLLVRPLEPTRLAHRMSPTPYLQVSATDDERIPRENARLLFEAASEPKRIHWMEGEHVLPHRDEIIEEMVRIALDELRRLGLIQTSLG